MQDYVAVCEIYNPYYGRHLETERPSLISHVPRGLSSSHVILDDD